VERLLANPGIVRNRAKVLSAINNARRYLEVQGSGPGFSRLLWSFADVPRSGARRDPGEIPARTPASEAMSRELRRLGFSFVGPTICYALMQACGLVNDHLRDCHRYPQCAVA
jgi:DNA-3-methyladenine glycosylase I